MGCSLSSKNLLFCLESYHFNTHEADTSSIGSSVKLIGHMKTWITGMRLLPWYLIGSSGAVSVVNRQ